MDDDVRYERFATPGMNLWVGLERIPLPEGPAPEIRPLSTIPCPYCGEIAWEGMGNADSPWLLGRAEAQIFAMGTNVLAHCTCGKGQAMRHDGVQPAGTSLEWRVRVCSREDLARHDAWRWEEPNRYAPWSEENLRAACPVCAGVVTLEFDANHEPGARCAYHDDPDERTHHGRCESCGASIAVDMAAVERPEYADELAAWKEREPKLAEWRMPG